MIRKQKLLAALTAAFVTAGLWPAALPAAAAAPLPAGKEAPAMETNQAAQTLSYEGYTLRWQDEFDGAELNRDDWNVELHEPGWVNNELQSYVDSPENIYLEDGKLVLKPVETKNADGTVSYTSGRVNTQNKHDFKYGIFEARAKVPAGQGFLPAFWKMRYPW